MPSLPKIFCLLLTLSFTLAGLPAASRAEAPSDSAKALVAAMTERLQLMEGVAQYKWNKAIPIEDLERERVVLDAVVASAKAKGVSVDLATDFFQAQITAAKAIQNRLFDAWRAQKAGSFADAPDLKADVRPAIGALTDKIIGTLARLDSIDAGAVCAALAPVPASLSEDAAAWTIAVAPLRKKMNGC